MKSPTALTDLETDRSTPTRAHQSEHVAQAARPPQNLPAHLYAGEDVSRPAMPEVQRQVDSRRLTDTIRRVAALAPERWMSVLATALLSLLAGLQQAFRFKELWTTYRATAEALKRELHYYHAAVHDYSEKTDEQKRTVFVDRIEAVLAQENALWIVAQRSQDWDETKSRESSTGS